MARRPLIRFVGGVRFRDLVPPTNIKLGRGLSTRGPIWRGSSSSSLVPMTTGFRRIAITLAISCTLIALVGAQPRPDTPQTTFRSSVDVVTIQASVRDARGRLVPGLTPKDFEVWDNGQVRPIVEFRSDLQSPVTLVIMVDMSG